MNANQLIEQVTECAKNNWMNSDLWIQSECMLEEMATHFSHCTKCKIAFDAQEYPETTLKEFENRLTGTVEDWICEEQ